MASGQARKSSSSDTKKQRFKQVGGRSSLKNEECEICNSCVDIDQKGIECEICKHWFHASCVDIEDNEYEVLTNHKKGSIHWYCEKCNVKSVELFTLVFNIQEKMQNSEMELEKMKNDTNAKFQKIETEYDAVRQDLRILNKKIEEGVQKCLDDSDKLVKSTHQQTITLHKDVEIEMNKTKAEVSNKLKEIFEGQESGSWSEIVKREVTSSLNNVSEDIQAVQNTLTETKTQVNEQRDKESRRNNIVIYRIPESTEARSEDRNKEDVSFCMQLFNNALQAGMTEEDIVNVFRLGRRTENGDPRPLMVQLGRYTSKNIVMESLYKLRGADRKFKSVVIAHDMTLAEREDCKRLVTEAKDLAAADTSGEYLYRVRGLPGQMKVLKIRVRN